MIVSIFLPWMPLYQNTPSLIGNASILLMEDDAISRFLQFYPQWGYSLILYVLVPLFLVVGGLLSAIFHDLKGGTIGLIGMLFYFLFYIWGKDMDGFIIPYSFGDFIAWQGIGFYFAWIGVILAFSGWYLSKKRLPPPP